MDRAAIQRIDAFAYRHRVGEAMTQPAVTVLPGATLQDAAQLMTANQISALVVVDEEDRPDAIMTEHDVLIAVARDGPGALGRPIDKLLSRPVASVAADDFLHTAISRMENRRIRHLAVVERGSGKLVGILIARAMLRQRAGLALALEEDIAAANDAKALAAAYRRLPVLCRGLLSEGLSAGEIAQIISASLRDITSRAAGLAEQTLLASARGPAPMLYAFLILGSAGRGESLLAADQDNALVHGGSEADDDWYAELGAKACDILNDAGVVYCSGGVMAKKKACRHSLDGWRSEIARWVEEREAIDLLNADIFYDFRAVHGDYRLAGDLRASAMALAHSPAFLMRLAHMLEPRSPALSPIFGFARDKNGRVDLKRGGLRSLVTAARVLALKIGSIELSTDGRLAAATKAGLLQPDDLVLFRDAHARLLRLTLEQQLLDIEAGRSPGTAVEIRRLPRMERERLKAALSAIGRIDLVVRDALHR